MKKILPHILSGISALALVPASAAHADQPLPATTVDDEGPDIIVTAPKLAGSVDVAIAADVVLDAAAVESYGASSVSDLLSALSAQTRSGRGRGDGRPVVLVNGKRVSSFGEIRDLPTEAIQRVEVLPEDVALRYGYTADQRVINFILKDNFSAITGEAQFGGPVAGGQRDYQAEAGLVRIGKLGRLNLNAEYDRSGALLESDRNIVSATPAETRYRTLTASNEAWKINSVLNRQIASGVDATLNLSYDRADTHSLFGIPTGSVGAIDPLDRDVRTRAYTGGLTLGGRIDRWNWTATATAARTDTDTLTDRNIVGPAPRDTTQSQLTTLGASWSAPGQLTELAAGALMLNLKTGFETNRIESEANRLGGLSTGRIARDEANVRANVDIPLTSRRRAVGSALGDLSINLNGGYRELSDFGAITAYGYGLNWSPIKGVTLLTSFAAEQAAPTAQQLGDPLVVTPNALVFDYVRGETALVSLTSGGNAGLRAEERKDVKIGLTYEPTWFEGLNLTANYFRNRSTDPVASFPALTAVIQSAFPDRFVRDGSGQLIAVDQRAINFLGSRSEQVRLGLSFQKQFGMPAGRGGAGASGTRGGAGGPPPGGGMGRFGGGQGGRWSLSLYDTIKFVDRIDVAAGVPSLDLLGGDATGQTGGTPRHSVELEGGWFNKGIGFRVNGTWQSGTTVTTGGASSLAFSDLATINLRAFVNFDQQKQLVEAVPFLKGSRLVLRVDNVFNDIQDVRDANGLVPLRYQKGYIDPVGRKLEIGFRKIF